MKTMQRNALILLIFCFKTVMAKDLPNIVLIIADDLGFSDISPFGSEIPTPNLEELAAQGVRLKHYYTSPMSAPARSMIMTGNSNQQAGMGGMWAYDSTENQPGYEFQLKQNIPTLAEKLNEQGYQTLMAGKWHLGYQPGFRPNSRGFIHSFALMAGGSDHFGQMIPLGTNEAFHTFYTEDDVRVSTLPNDFYSSSTYVKKLSQYITATPKEKPIFAYLAFPAPHDPLQAPADWVKKFENKYTEGYQKVYQARMERLKTLGFIDNNTPLPIEELNQKWQQLSDAEKARETKAMQIYAAMIAKMDDEVGQLIKTLKETGRYDNTIIIFAADNGASSSGQMAYSGTKDFWQQFDNSLTNMGRKNSFVSLGPNWAEVSDAPYAKYHKVTSGQGGINVSFIIAGPTIAHKGQIVDQQVNVYDLAPTIYEFAGMSRESVNQRSIPMVGKSHAEYFVNANPTEKKANEYFVELHHMKAYINKDNWKIRAIEPNLQNISKRSQWTLYDLNNDPLETQDLSAKHPILKLKMILTFNQWAKRHGVIEAKGKKHNYVGKDNQGKSQFKP